MILITCILQHSSFTARSRLMANIKKKIQKHLIINYISGNKKLPLIGQFLLHHEYS
jgi:hypothetical protein